MLTEKDYCDYDTCVALKELGFNALVDWYFNEDKRTVSSLATYRDTYIPRISLYEAQKWLREEKGIDLAVYSGKGKDTDRIWVCNLVMENKARQLTYEGVVVKTFSSYEEALLEGIKEAVKILKEE